MCSFHAYFCLAVVEEKVLFLDSEQEKDKSLFVDKDVMQFVW